MDLINCPICLGSGYGRDEGPNTKFCSVCKGEGEISQEQLDKILDGAQEFYQDDGDWAYDRSRDT